MTKQHILSEIKRTAKANSGKPLGWRAFERDTGIRYADWYGVFWKSWGDAVTEAGLEPNTMQRPFTEGELLDAYVKLVVELGRVPVEGDLRLKRRADKAFPNSRVFIRRFGSTPKLHAKAREYCLPRPDLEHLAKLFREPSGDDVDQEPAVRRPDPLGFVYLLKVGRHYKIGKTNSVGRRTRELEIQLPEKAKTVHVIKTDDPNGIEAYWHGRFASKRGNGEWFALDAADVAAFKRRSFQ